MQLATHSDPFIGCPEKELLKENWLTDDMSVANYICPDCGAKHQVEISRRVPDQRVREYRLLCPCSEVPSTCKYDGLNSRKVNIMYKTTFEKNGRKAVKTQFANGKSFIRSQTKENAMNGKSHKSVLTSGHQEAVNKEKHKNMVDKEKQMKAYVQQQNANKGKK